MNAYSSGIIDCLPPYDEERRERAAAPQPWKTLARVLSKLVKALVKLFD